MLKYIECVFYAEDSKVNQTRLFEEAITHAKNGKVLYITKDELNELPELSQDLCMVNRHYLKMISFLYAKSLESLIESVSTLPDWKNVPHTIILEDLNRYCGENVQNACATVAMLLDAAFSCYKVLNIPCRLCISVTKGAPGFNCFNSLQDLYCDNTIIMNLNK